MKYVLAVAAMALGIAAVILGELDDSPGLQLIGVLLVVAGIVVGVKTLRGSTAFNQGRS